MSWKCGVNCYQWRVRIFHKPVCLIFRTEPRKLRPEKSTLRPKKPRRRKKGSWSWRCFGGGWPRSGRRSQSRDQDRREAVPPTLSLQNGRSVRTSTTRTKLRVGHVCMSKKRPALAVSTINSSSSSGLNSTLTADLKQLVPLTLPTNFFNIC